MQSDPIPLWITLARIALGCPHATEDSFTTRERERWERVAAYTKKRIDDAVHAALVHAKYNAQPTEQGDAGANDQDDDTGSLTGRNQRRETVTRRDGPESSRHGEADRLTPASPLPPLSASGTAEMPPTYGGVPIDTTGDLTIPGLVGVQWHEDFKNEAGGPQAGCEPAAPSTESGLSLMADLQSSSERRYSDSTPAAPLGTRDEEWRREFDRLKRGFIEASHDRIAAKLDERPAAPADLPPTFKGHQVPYEEPIDGPLFPDLATHTPDWMQNGSRFVYAHEATAYLQARDARIAADAERIRELGDQLAFAENALKVAHESWSGAENECLRRRRQVCDLDYTISRLEADIERLRAVRLTKPDVQESDVDYPTSATLTDRLNALLAERLK